MTLLIENSAQEIEELQYEILKTGSKGNCVVIEDIMIDCGIPFSKMKDVLYDVKYLLLTHIHSDHIKPATLQKIKDLFPKITILGNYEVAQKFGVDIIVNNGFETLTRDYTFMAVKGVHDVLVTGYSWWVKGQHVCYMTDTNSYDGFKDAPYDLFFIELNYDEKKLQAIGNNFKTRGYNPVLSAKRHASVQLGKGFYYSNRRSVDSVLIPLHMSERFF